MATHYGRQGELIDAYSHINTYPREADALLMLRKLASCVLPIMRKRGWRVGMLCEFYPDQQNLLGLNINRGQRINVRLRHARDVNLFLDFHQCLDTLLHELVHIVQGPHDERFHRLWDELRDEWETLQMKGYSGEGFLSAGRSLGGHVVPNDELRRRARASAAQRQSQAVASGHRLGGNGFGSFYGRPDPGQMAAAAASRSTTGTSITSGCGAGSEAANRAADEALRHGFRTTADMTEADEIAIQNALIELMEEEEGRKLNGLPAHPSEETWSTLSEGLTWDPVNGLQSLPSSGSSTPRTAAASRSMPGNAPPVPSHSKPSSTTGSSKRPASSDLSTGSKKGSRNFLKKAAPSSVASAAAPTSTSSTWPCATCTLLNNASATRCDACDQPKPGLQYSSRQERPTQKPPRSYGSSLSYNPLVSTKSTPDFMTKPTATAKPLGWSCQTCGTWMEACWWTCSVCGNMKTSS